MNSSGQNLVGMDFSGRTVVGMKVTFNEKGEMVCETQPHARITRGPDGRETFSACAYSAEELNSVDMTDRQVDQSNESIKRNAIRDILDKYRDSHPNRARVTDSEEVTNDIKIETKVKSKSHKHKSRSHKHKKMSDAERILREAFGNKPNKAEAVRTSTNKSNAGRGDKDEAISIEFTGGTPSDATQTSADEIKKSLLSGWEVHCCVIGEGAYVSPFIYGSCKGKMILKLRVKEGYGIYPKINGDCVIERWSNGGVKVKNYYGLNEDIPQKSINKMSNDQFVEYLYQIGLPRTALISREDF